VDLQDLLQHLIQNVFASASIGEIQSFTVAEIFLQKTGFHLKPHTTSDELFNLASRLDLKPQKDFGWNDLYHSIWVAHIEPKLPQTPFLLTHYPASQAALAKLNHEG